MIDLAKQGDEETINSWITVNSLFVVLLFFLDDFIVYDRGGDKSIFLCFGMLSL